MVIILFILAACGGGGANVSSGGSTTAPTVSNVRIGINDSGVDINHSEFTNRIQSAGAIFTVMSTSTDTSAPSTTKNTFLPMSSSASDAACATQSGNLCLFVRDTASPTTSPYADVTIPTECTGTGADVQACARAMLQLVSGNIPEDPSPEEGNTVFGRDDTDEDLTLTIYNKDNSVTYHLPTADFIEHGTAVASIALRDAPSATTIVPIFAQLLTPVSYSNNFLTRVSNGTEPNSDYSNIDIVNRSYGTPREQDTKSLFVDRYQPLRDAASGTVRRDWWNAEAQINVASANKTVVVWAAGNSADHDDNSGTPETITTHPSHEASLPHYFPELRDHWVAVAAVGGDNNNPSTIANYSNHCGARAASGAAWDEAAHGRHYCLAAVGAGAGAATVNGGSNYAEVGTSFAAPRVTGAIAAVMRGARGQMSAVGALSRIKATANNTGDYATTAIYGAGLLDLTAALRAVGTTTLSAPNGLSSSVQNAVLRPRPAYGAAAAKGLSGLEITAFDELNYPFWYSASTMVDTTVAAPVPLWQRMGDAHTIIEEAGLKNTLRWHTITDAKYGTLRLALADNTLGFSAAPFDSHKGALAALRLGLLVENDVQHNRLRSSGAFDSRMHSGLVFAGFQHTFGNETQQPWRLQSQVMFAAGKTDHEEGALFETSGSLYSSASLALQYAKDDSRTRFHIEQPLRAETGYGTLHYAYARTLDGTHLYRKHQFSLVPVARAIHLGVRHDRKVAHGQFAVELLHILNHGHVSGASYSQVNLAWQLAW